MVMQGITSTNDQFIRALRQGDASGCASVYPQDGIVLPANAPMSRGRAAIQKFWQGAIDMGLKDATLKTLELDEQGDTTVEIGAYTLEFRSPEGKATQDKGKYLVVWKRQRDGSWKWRWDMFSSDSPPPGR